MLMSEIHCPECDTRDLKVHTVYTVQHGERRRWYYWRLHNFVRPHFTAKQVPAVTLGIVPEGLSVAELFRLHCVYP